MEKILFYHEKNIVLLDNWNFWFIILEIETPIDKIVAFINVQLRNPA